MKDLLRLTLLLIISNLSLNSQEYPGFGSLVQLKMSEIDKAIRSKNISGSYEAQIPFPNSQIKNIRFELSKNDKSSGALLFRGIDLQDHSVDVRLTKTENFVSIAYKYQGAYYFIDELEKGTSTYLLYKLGDGPERACGSHGNILGSHKVDKQFFKNLANFPIGNQLKKFRFAAAATGEMGSAMGGNTQARDQIIAIINAANLIYENEVSIEFDLISATTTSMNIIFTNGNTDFFTVDPNFANASNARSGFIAMNSSETLPYADYDIGHVFHINNGGGISASGQAGPDPCNDSFKAFAWTEFTSGAIPFIGFITGLFVHEVGHQFRAWHTYNASYGFSSFCDQGWSSTASVAPGSGSTIMGYGNNCSTPTNFVLTSPNSEDYFHTKSLEQILNSLENHATCYTSASTSNTPPESNAGTDFTIPKGTPFYLNGIASDINGGNQLSYVWDQMDVATSNDRGSLGSSVNGFGGYPAVNSTASAPLFRSRMSNSTTERYFPSLTYVLDGSNNPPDNVGEDLPQVGRELNFYFTVRDNEGGVDADDIKITVDGNAGPLNVTSFNSGSSAKIGEYVNITWDVNNTNQISANVKISLSTDGGATFPIDLAATTTNDGSESVLIPTNLSVQNDCRIKIAGLNHATHEFFDINNSNFSLTAATHTCSDMILNGDETDVDCGGPSCPACPTCMDNIQNQGEEGVDCGGPCAAVCATCTDGIQNGGETDVDCGGSDCDPCVYGCTITAACNYNPSANINTGCEYTSCAGCTEVFASNYDPTKTINNGTCIYDCTDSFNTIASNSVANDTIITSASTLSTSGTITVNYGNPLMWRSTNAVEINANTTIDSELTIDVGPCDNN